MCSNWAVLRADGWREGFTLAALRAEIGDVLVDDGDGNLIPETDDGNYCVCPVAWEATAALHGMTYERPNWDTPPRDAHMLRPISAPKDPAP